ncbi:tetratricopeptide repeat-containing sensor histidine kinase [Zunongwangia endophytica]|uniref:Tetratricopeptide repeat protein n=1 Tax=Zunongwangia endophytica TaxID=1808945 RepID=A0ABV8H5L1_9FLAO|nr:tetratricopeptide repeat-containing sensor histidine kinase [Zunongwangia endophytica]MDN3595988.1 tetratricopeptide repeat protein [Zunongwangia endophytica]
MDSSYYYLKNEDSVRFFKTNSRAITFTNKINDSTGKATAYWDRGQFYYYFGVMDSAYFYFDKAQKGFARIGNKKRAGQLLLNMAVIQGYYKNYTGSEILLSEAINDLKDQGANKSLYFAYNNLGTLSRNLKEFERSVIYYKKAEEYLKEVDDANEYPSLWNNLGLVYTTNGEYKKALDYYTKGLKAQRKLKSEDVDLEIKAMLIDNRAYAKQNLLDTIGIYEEYLEALMIREDQELYAGQSMSYIHFSEYFILKGDTSNAISLALKSKMVADKINATENYLESLKLLADIDLDKALDYTKEYIKLSDSLYFVERGIRNKLARIRFETDEYINETKTLNQRIFRISTITGIIIIFLILISIIVYQRSRNRLFRQKEEAGKEIYKLILNQQQFFEDGREKERLNISRELHDGVLGQLFGLRLSLDILNEDDSKESKQKRKNYIEEIAKVAKEIRNISHKLNVSSFVTVNFKVILEELVNQQKVHGLRVNFEIDEEINWDKISDDIKINIYRILQEALTNINQHANAQLLKISILRRQNTMYLTIADDGVGFSSDKAIGIGIKNMKSRCKSIGADFALSSKLTVGTKISISVKIK